LFLFIQVFGACAAKKFGGKLILLLSVFLWSISTVATPWVSHNTFALILCRIISGFGEGLGKSISNKRICEMLQNI